MKVKEVELHLAQHVDNGIEYNYFIELLDRYTKYNPNRERLIDYYNLKNNLKKALKWEIKKHILILIEGVNNMEYQIIWNYGTENEEIVDTANSYEEGLYLIQEYQIAFNSNQFVLEGEIQ